MIGSSWAAGRRITKDLALSPMNTARSSHVIRCTQVPGESFSLLLLLRFACEAEEGVVMQPTRLVSMGYTAYWWVMRYRAWLLIFVLVVVGAVLGSTMGAD